eukprot:TRINITY_DN26907_c0_g1_i1.p1 TRINITY_DN26907_c0_g1~~TRINITY_DN26907_c0_g1_i1.p1  ORF type:complete len:435 (-),score=67.51 TRINITY_DN26907_c0_g1_i1:32-1300(-)
MTEIAQTDVVADVAGCVASGGAGDEDQLRWPGDAEEQALIAKVREIVCDVDLSGLPEDVCDDLQIARFLRGNANDPQASAAFFSESVAYRRELQQDESIQAMRRGSANLDIPDLKLLPYADEMLRINPMMMVGFTTSKLPVMVTCPRFLDFETFGDCVGKDFPKYEAFLKGMLEQRALILHNLSHKQGRMAKFVDIRDFNQVPVTKLVSHATNAMGKIKQFFSVVQNFYPEMNHKVFCYSAPSGVRLIFDLVSSFLNARMLSKIRIFSVGIQFDQMSQLLEARAIHVWFSEVARRLRFREIYIANGTQEYCGVWCEAGETCRWSCVLPDGTDIKLIRVFVPDKPTSNDDANFDMEEVTVAGSGEGSYTPASAGVLAICLCNIASWWNAKTVTLKINGAIVGLPETPTGDVSTDAAVDTTAES